MPGTQPTVEIAVRRLVTPRSGRRSQAASTLSMFIVGSPMPMKTTWSTSSTRRKWSTWSRISSAVRLRANFIFPVAQKVQVSGQPDCDETQTDLPPVAVAHQHRLDRPPVAGVEKGLDRAVIRTAPRPARSASRSAGPPRASPAARRADSSSPHSSRPRARPTPRPGNRGKPAPPPRREPR